MVLLNEFGELVRDCVLGKPLDEPPALRWAKVFIDKKVSRMKEKLMDRFFFIREFFKRIFNAVKSLFFQD